MFGPKNSPEQDFGDIAQPGAVFYTINQYQRLIFDEFFVGKMTVGNGNHNKNPVRKGAEV